MNYENEEHWGQSKSHLLADIVLAGKKILLEHKDPTLTILFFQIIIPQ